MSDLLHNLNEHIKSLGGDWSKYTVVGSFLLYVVGYLALRFHLTAIGIGTDLAVLDERYLFTGARFLVYLVSSVPNIVLAGLPLAALAWGVHRLLPAGARARVCAWVLRPARLTFLGILFAVLMIQFVMRQCFFLSDLLLARALPAEPAWLVDLMLDGRLMPLYFSALVAGCAVPIAILWALRNAPLSGPGEAFGRGLLAFLAAVQVLLLPINYGVLIADKTLARVAWLGDRTLKEGEEAWLVWEGKEGVTFLVRDGALKRRSLLTLQRSKIEKLEIVGFDRILPTLFGARQGSGT
jgi:hypothetical protein